MRWFYYSLRQKRRQLVFYYLSSLWGHKLCFRSGRSLIISNQASIWATSNWRSSSLDTGRYKYCKRHVLFTLYFMGPVPRHMLLLLALICTQPYVEHISHISIFNPNNKPERQVQLSHLTDVWQRQRKVQQSAEDQVKLKLSGRAKIQTQVSYIVFPYLNTKTTHLIPPSHITTWPRSLGPVSNVALIFTKDEIRALILQDHNYT
jgi:hypothetical protein